MTIDGIVHVIDCGFTKIRAYNAQYNSDCLAVMPISRAAAVQRAGRAGRTRPGKAYRLYTRSVFETVMPAAAVPEMVRTNLASVVLQVRSTRLAETSSHSPACTSLRT